MSKTLAASGWKAVEVSRNDVSSHEAVSDAWNSELMTEWTELMNEWSKNAICKSMSPS